MNKRSLFFLPIFLCVTFVCVTLNGMSGSPKADDQVLSLDEPLIYEMRLNTLEQQLSKDTLIHQSLASRVHALEEYAVTLAAMQANSSRAAERTEIQKRIRKIKCLRNTLSSKKSGQELQTQLEELAIEHAILQDKLHALEESIPE